MPWGLAAHAWRQPCVGRELFPNGCADVQGCVTKARRGLKEAQNVRLLNGPRWPTWPRMSKYGAVHRKNHNCRDYNNNIIIMEIIKKTRRPGSAGPPGVGYHVVPAG